MILTVGMLPADLVIFLIVILVLICWDVYLIVRITILVRFAFRTVLPALIVVVK